MFKNRSFNIKMVKDGDETYTRYTNRSIDYNRLINTVSINVAFVVVIYLGGDTLRQVLINALKRS